MNNNWLFWNCLPVISNVLMKIYHSLGIKFVLYGCVIGGVCNPRISCFCGSLMLNEESLKPYFYISTLHCLHSKQMNPRTSSKWLILMPLELKAAANRQGCYGIMRHNEDCSGRSQYRGSEVGGGDLNLGAAQVGGGDRNIAVFC